MAVSGPAGAGGDTIRFHELLQRWGPAYLERFGTAVPWRQREVLEKLLACRTPALGAWLGMLGLLHPWSRTLIYHPHVHYLVPAGGLSLDQRQWVPSRQKFLVHVHPLADHYRTLFYQALEPPEPLPPPESKPLCPHCRRPMIHCGSWSQGQPRLRPPVRGPP